MQREIEAQSRWHTQRTKLPRVPQKTRNACLCSSFVSRYVRRLNREKCAEIGNFLYRKTNPNVSILEESKVKPSY